MTISTYAQTDNAEMGYKVTGMKALWVKSKEAFMRSLESEIKQSAPDIIPADPPEEPYHHQVVEVMIIDDEPIVGKRLQPALTKHGYNVEVFTNPVKAMKRFDEKEFDIVVTDMRMDQLNGMEVLNHVQSGKTKVIFISGYATVESAREAMVKGAFDFISKPFKPGDLRTVIGKAASSLGYNDKK